MPESKADGFISHAAEFGAVMGERPRLVKVIETDSHEGPVYVRGEDALYFTTVPQPSDDPFPGCRRVAIKRLALDGDRFPVRPGRMTTVREAANGANGMTLDPQGRLLVCEQGSWAEPGRISRLDLHTGVVETVVDAWRGLRLNSPNDVVVRRDGTIWFTDPSYGYWQGFKPAPMVGDYVYRYDPCTTSLSVVADSFDKPNGLAFSPDEATLYIADSGAIQGPGTYYANRPHHVLAYDVREGRHLVNGRLLAVITPGFPDGLKVDSEGRVYVSSASGVLVYNPSGDLIGEIRLAGGVVNFTFGGLHNNILFITAETAIWAAMLQATGVTA